MSRLIVQVVLRDRMSTSPDCRAVKRSLALSGVNFTFVPSPKMAAATARQKSTSRPVHSPLSSGAEKPARAVLTPHWTKPFAFTSSRVAAEAAEAITPNAAAPRMPNIVFFITLNPLSVLVVPELLWCQNSCGARLFPRSGCTASSGPFPNSASISMQCCAPRAEFASKAIIPPRSSGMTARAPVWKGRRKVLPR